MVDRKTEGAGTVRYQHNYSLNQEEQDKLLEALEIKRKQDKYFNLKELLMIAVNLVLGIKE
jgi:hypothetical protein